VSGFGIVREKADGKQYVVRKGGLAAVWFSHFRLTMD
jgi:hypothetical protein